MTKITAAERVFLSRAEAVTEKKRTRAAHYEQHLQVLIAELQPGNMSRLSKQIPGPFNCTIWILVLLYIGERSWEKIASTARSYRRKYSHK